MTDQWYFEIGDGHTYGPFPLEKLQRWAASGNLMPTHRVRNADSSEWVIAAYVPGLELTTADTEPVPDTDNTEPPASIGKSIGTLVRGLGRQKKSPSEEGGPSAAGDTTTVKAHTPLEPPDIVGLCEELLEAAFERGASDLHVDPEERIVLVQLRVDGELETLRKLPKSLHGPVVGRFKVLSNMDIAEHRMPQDGRFVYKLGPKKRKVSIRAACLPTTHGERLTLRLLAVETEELTLNRLGMSEGAYRTFVQFAAQRQGMILMTGPTGSGKSTTLYAALRYRLANYPGRIITVEDPVEFDVVGVAQTEVDVADKVRFNTVLRNILRSDPDVVMIGEIRDYDSVDIAIKAALTGHLVFSSLHTNSAAGVITRLIDMGVKPYQVAATLRLCVAQRLVRRLCPHCRQPRKLTSTEAQAICDPRLAGVTIYEPGHCPKCGDRGFRGRIGLFEMLSIDEEIARRIVAGCDEGVITSHMRDRKIHFLQDDALDKLRAGVTSLGELMAVVQW
jgi:type II secretory ATPase GspE/PulE/Tfp pilus assembly ATPase PilB-like protein